MKAIKVNADYESVLFNNKPLPVVNEALEFLAFFLDERPVLSPKKYSDIYLKHVEYFTGRKPLTIHEGDFVNWWGPLNNLQMERELNSKETSAKLNPDSFILTSLNDLPSLENKTFLAKNPFGMSGQNFSLVEEGRTENLEVILRKGKVILEPLFERIYDFSHYVFPNKIEICYQNIVDSRFQYRGTIYNDYTSPSIQNLSFYDEVSPEEWKNFKTALTSIRETYERQNLSCGYSIDSFVYRTNEKNKIRALSEVNYRRTMGMVAFELSLKFGGIRKWSAFLLSKSSGMSFEDMQKILKPISWKAETSRGVILLSPGDVRYDMFFLSALNKKEGTQLVQELRNLLPDSEFTVEI
jgi:hypothetical protein